MQFTCQSPDPSSDNNPDRQALDIEHWLLQKAHITAHKEEKHRRSGPDCAIPVLALVGMRIAVLFCGSAVFSRITPFVPFARIGGFHGRDIGQIVHTALELDGVLAGRGIRSGTHTERVAPSLRFSPAFVARAARCRAQRRLRPEGRGVVLDSTSSTPRRENSAGCGASLAAAESW